MYGVGSPTSGFTTYKRIMDNNPLEEFFLSPKETPSISYKILQMRLLCTNPYRVFGRDLATIPD